MDIGALSTYIFQFCVGYCNKKSIISIFGNINYSRFGHTTLNSRIIVQACFIFSPMYLPVYTLI